MQKLLIYGASGLGREILETVMDINSKAYTYDVLGWLDDGILPGTVINNFSVLGNSEYLADNCEAYAIVLAIANPEIKEMLYNKIKSINPYVRFPYLVHPTAQVSASAQIDDGVVISRLCWVSIDTKLDKFVLLNTKCDVAHDSKIGAFSSLMPSVEISGNVTVGTKVFCGVQSAVHQGLTIGNGAIIGMGSKVMLDVPAHCTVLGNPAKIIQRREK